MEAAATVAGRGAVDELEAEAEAEAEADAKKLLMVRRLGRQRGGEVPGQRC